MLDDVRFDLDRNQATLGNEPMVFHCHHYNCALQKAVEDNLGERAPALLQAAAVNTVRGQLEALGGDPLAAAAEAYRTLGFGTLAVTLDGDRGEAVCHNAHYSLGWLAKYGARTTPVDHFTCGFVQAAASLAAGVSPDRVAVHQTRCMTMGAAENHFRIEVTR